MSWVNSDIRMKRCCLLKKSTMSVDGFEGFRAGCVCLLVMHQGPRVETPEFGSKRPLYIYIGYYVVLKYDEVSKIMVPQIAWSSIHLIAGTSIWWNCHLLVRWWLGMILHSLKRIAWGSAGPKDLCSQMLRAMCKASGDEETLESYHWWCKGISTDWFFRWGKTVMTHDKTSTYLMFLIFCQPTDFFMLKVFLFWLSFSSLLEND